MEKGFTFRQTLWLPRKRPEVFAFFSDASNLQKLTPPWLDFRIESSLPVEMRQGAKLEYRLKVRGFPMSWVSEITAWEPPRLFVDRQIRGPYRLWVHEHRFEERDGGTAVIDQIRYDHFGGRLVNALLVSRDIRKIFAYRSDRLLARFGPDAVSDQGANSED